MAHADNGQVRQIPVFQPHMTDCISIRYVNRHHLQAFCFRVVPLLGLRAVSCFSRYGFCHDVLELKVFVQHRHSGFQRPILPIEAGGDDGNQHIGIVPNFVCIHLHFIIFRMMAGVIAHFLFELPFHVGIRTFCRFYVRFLRRISANHDGFQHRLRQRRTGLQAAHHRKEQRRQRKHRPSRRMAGKRLAQPFLDVFGFGNCICCYLRRGSNVIGWTAGRFCGGILLPDGAFPLPAGIVPLGGFPRVRRRPERFFLHVVCCQRGLHSAVLIFIGFCRLMMELGMGCMNTLVKQRRMASFRLTGAYCLHLFLLAELQAGCAAMALLFHQRRPSLCCIR